MKAGEFFKGVDIGLSKFIEESHGSCLLEFKRIRSPSGIAAFYCKAHNETVYVFPVARTWHYAKLEDFKTGV